MATWRLVITLGALLAGACGGSATSPSQTAFSLSGQVTSALTSSPVAGATVTIVDGPNAGKTATTDGSGNYGFSGLERAGFTVSVSADGFAPQSQGISLTSNQTASFRLTGTRNLIYNRSMVLNAHSGTGSSFRTSRLGRIEIETSWSNASSLVRLEFALEPTCGAPQYLSNSCAWLYADRSAVSVARRTATIESVAPNSYIVWLTNQGAVSEPTTLDVYLTP
jgi:hypothetical protein